MRTYIIYKQSRQPLIYTSDVDKITNIEDLEFANDDDLKEEKDAYVQKTQFYNNSYPSRQCEGFFSLKNSINVTIQKNRTDYFLIARNLSLCVAINERNSLFQEEIIGTIVSEVSMVIIYLYNLISLTKKKRYLKLPIKLVKSFKLRCGGV